MVALKGSEILKHAVLSVLHDVEPMFEIRSEFEMMQRVKSLGQSRSDGMCTDRKRYGSRREAITAELSKSRYDVPQGVGVENRYEAELINRRRGSGSEIY